MCLLALFFRAVEDAPVVVGGNRDEFYDRPGEPPRRLEGMVPILAGVDPRGGGSWFGVNAAGLVVAVTNRPKSRPPLDPPSRGLLVRELLAKSTCAADAVRKASVELDHNRYAGCNVLCVDADQAVVLQAGDWLRVHPLPSGLHLIANHDVNDETDSRLGYAFHWLGTRPYRNASECLTALQELCGQTGAGRTPPICLRGSDRGTVSSSLVAIRRPFERSSYLHAQGPPDRTPYVSVSAELRQLGPWPARRS